MKLAICDFDERYVSSLVTYLYGKCPGSTFSSFTTIEDYMASLLSNEYIFTIMGDEFYYVLRAGKEEGEYKENINFGKLIILSASIDNMQNEEVYQTVYKYGPMDGLYRMLDTSVRKRSDSKRFAVYSPTHHELMEMYALSMCQVLQENSRVLLIDTCNYPVIRRLIRDGPRAGIIDVIYKLENDRAYEIKDMIDEYSGFDVLPFSLNPTDISSIDKRQWKELIDYIDSLKYEAFVFAIDDINQGFREIMEYVDSCVLINRRGDYYKGQQDTMKEYIKNVGATVTEVELKMTANNLNEGCYKLEELLTGNLGRLVRRQSF